MFSGVRGILFLVLRAEGSDLSSRFGLAIKATLLCWKGLPSGPVTNGEIGLLLRETSDLFNLSLFSSSIRRDIVTLYAIAS
jgi:hypothetical protein